MYAKSCNLKLSCIVYAKSRYNENYHINSKSYVNFQVELKQNHVKRAMPVFMAQLKVPLWLLPDGNEKNHVSPQRHSILKRF